MHRFLMLFALALASITALAGCTDSSSTGTAPEGKVLKFTAIPDQNTTELKQKYTPVAEYLSEKLGVKVEYVPAADYGASVEMFKNGDVHLAWFGGLTGVQARHAVDGATAIAQGVEDPKYLSYFIAHKDSGIEPGKDFPTAIANLSFTFGSQSSTSGRLMPEFFIRSFTGKDPEEFFGKKPMFSGNHDKTCEMVESGQVQVGAVSYTTYDKRVKAGTTDPEVCRIIWRTPHYADYNLTAHPEIDTLFGEGTTARVKKAFLEMKDESLLAAFRRTGFIEAKNEDFSGIVEVAQELGLVQ